MTDAFEEVPDYEPMPVPVVDDTGSESVVLGPGDYLAALDLLGLPSDAPAVLLLPDDEAPGEALVTPHLDEESVLAVALLPEDDMAAAAELTVSDPGAKQIVLTPGGAFSIACDYPEPTNPPQEA